MLSDTSRRNWIVAAVLLAIVALGGLIAMTVMGPQTVPLYCPANPDYCPSLSP